MHDMQHGELTPFQLAPRPPSGDASKMPLGARLFRWLVMILGILLLLLAALRLPVPSPAQSASLIVLALVSLAAELLLTIRFNQQRAISFGATFAFTTFLVFGAATATLIQVLAWLCSQLLQRLDQRRTPSSWIFICFNLGQLALCGLTAGSVIWLTLGAPLNQPPDPANFLAALLIYALSYLIVNVLLTTIAIWLRFGWREVHENLWPNVSLWTALSFGLSVPLTIFIFSMRNRVDVIADIVLTFAFLAILSYVVRINLRFQAINRELQVLNGISRRLSSSLDVADLFPALYQEVRKVMPTDVFLIGLVNEDGTAIHAPYLVEGGELLAPRTLALENSLADHVLRTGESIFLSKLSLDAAPNRFGRSDKHVTAVLLTPLSLADQRIGVISAQSYTPNVYTREQLRLLEAIGGVAAVAINNARLFAREKDVLRSREEFVSLVAHELKNPLAALLGHTQLLERRLRLADDKLRRPIGIIHEQGERMNRLVEDLLDLSRADSGRLPLHHQRIDMAALTRDVVEQQRPLSIRHRLVIEGADTLPLIEGDAMRLTQVLQNLLSNAIKYSPSGGQITVRLATVAADDPLWPRRLRKSLAGATSWVVVQVIDQGIGVPSDQLGRIFDRFYRANNISQLDIAGSGLGLSVCEGLVRAHGGVIWAESEWGVGSTFSFGLPAAQVEEPAASVAGPE
jgi:signal transduction histidine kinase